MSLDDIQSARNDAVRDLALKQVRPDPKEQPVRQRKYRRKVASPKQWQAISSDKNGPCRVCGKRKGAMNLHHLVPRGRGGDDVADNIVPLCIPCHRTITDNYAPNLRVLAESLSDGEYSYIIEKLGEGGMHRLFQVDSR